MSDRERDCSKAFIDCKSATDEDEIDIIVFDMEEPYIFYMTEEDISPRNYSRWKDYNNTEDEKFSARMNIQKGIVRNVEFENDNKKEKALQIARHYRPGIGRYDSAVYASIILNFYNIPIESSSLKNLRLSGITNEPDNLIKDEILAAFSERHNIYTGTTNHDKPRFITIPYSIKIKTPPISWLQSGHFVTLIVDLDYRDNNGNLKPFVYVYDSAHMLCEWYGVGNNRLNKNDYFKFGNNILVDDEVLNNERNICCCFGNIVLSNRVQKFHDFRCGYYTEAAIDLLLEDDTFTDNDGGNIQPRGNTRNFLRNILNNANIIYQIDNVIIPPNPYEWFSY